MNKQFKHTPKQLYNSAIEESNSSDEIVRREGYEKGWLATITAIDVFLEQNNYPIEEGTPETNINRLKALNELSNSNPIVSEIQDDMDIVMSELHGRCFYEGIESERCSRVLKYNVKNVLKKTGSL